MLVLQVLLVLLLVMLPLLRVVMLLRCSVQPVLLLRIVATSVVIVASL